MRTTFIFLLHQGLVATTGKTQQFNRHYSGEIPATVYPNREDELRLKLCHIFVAKQPSNS